MENGIYIGIYKIDNVNFALKHIDLYYKTLVAIKDGEAYDVFNKKFINPYLIINADDATHHAKNNNLDEYANKEYSFQIFKMSQWFAEEKKESPNMSVLVDLFSGIFIGLNIKEQIRKENQRVYPSDLEVNDAKNSYFNMITNLILENYVNYTTDLLKQK